MKSQIIYGYSIDEKCSVHKNRLGASIYLQTNKRDKYGISANYNYSKYKYPVNTTAIAINNFENAGTVSASQLFNSEELELENAENNSSYSA